MKYIPIMLLLLAPVFGCQTSAPRLTPPPVTETTVHCSMKLANAQSSALGNLEVEARFSSAPKSQVLIALKRGEQAFPDIITSDISNDGIIKFSANATDFLEIDVHGIPTIAGNKTVDEHGEVVRMSVTTFGSEVKSTAPCIYFSTTSSAPNANIATCNAEGTPAQGWYHDGRFVKHSASCTKELLSCGDGKNSGWYLQKKKNQVLAKLEKCSWMKNSPQCVSKSSVAGWHIGNRLVSRDDNCVYKHIECRKHGTKKEGWYVYEHTKPELLLSESCRTNQKTADLGQ
jgi:hypothetical protein